VVMIRGGPSQGSHSEEVRGKGVRPGDEAKKVCRGKRKGSREGVVGALDVQLML